MGQGGERGDRRRERGGCSVLLRDANDETKDGGGGTAEVGWGSLNPGWRAAIGAPLLAAPCLLLPSGGRVVRGGGCVLWIACVCVWAHKTRERDETKTGFVRWTGGEGAICSKKDSELNLFSFGIRHAPPLFDETGPTNQKTAPEDKRERKRRDREKKSIGSRRPEETP